MQATYDRETDSLYVSLRGLLQGEKVQRTLEVSDGVQLDLDAAGNPVGLEVLWASERYPVVELQGLPGADGFMTLSSAAQAAGLSVQTLRVQAGAGRLRAVKRGRDWFTTPGWLSEYLAGRKHRGPGSARSAS